MAANRNAALTEQVNRIGEPSTALEFDHLRARLHKNGGIIHRLHLCGVGHERHIGHQQRTVVAALNRFCVIGHIIDGYR